LRNKLGQLPADDPIRGLLEQMVVDAGRDAEKLKSSIENWFNGAMERLSGWYKKWAYLWLLHIGAVITVALAVDTIEVAKYLATNQPAREMLVANATSFLKANQSEQGATSSITCPSDDGTGASPPSDQKKNSPTNQSAKSGTDQATNPPTTEATKGAADQKTNVAAKGGASQQTNPPGVNNLANCYRLLQKTVSDQGYPIGWNSLLQRIDDARKSEAKSDHAAPPCWYSSCAAWRVVGQTLIGFIFTILAIAMGSNFWFDSLRNLMNLRAAGPRPQTNGKKDASGK
jgi:hypothetical protein